VNSLPDARTMGANHGAPSCMSDCTGAPDTEDTVEHCHGLPSDSVLEERVGVAVSVPQVNVNRDVDLFIGLDPSLHAAVKHAIQQASMDRAAAVAASPINAAVQHRELKPKDPRAQLLCNVPPVWSIEDFLTEEEVQNIIRVNEPALLPRATWQGDPAEKIRTSSVNLVQMDGVILNIKQRVASALGIRVEQIEHPSMARYQPGQEYKTHFDWLHGHLPEMKRAGQRVWTCLLYLTDSEDLAGGETCFPCAKPSPLRIKPRRGKAVFWPNVLLNGSVDGFTFHAGLPPIKGTKYVLNIWTRERDTPPSLAQSPIKLPAPVHNFGAKTVVQPMTMPPRASQGWMQPNRVMLAA